MRCLDCQYNLKKLAEHRCPECSRAFDPDDPSSFDNGAEQGREYWVRYVGTVLLLIALCALAILIFVLIVEMIADRS